MSKIISGEALRERLLGRRASAPAPSADGFKALATPGNRELLILIALRRPRSISELSEFADRAQPNVSRSLTALIHAGLVEVRSEGRLSVPTDRARSNEGTRTWDHGGAVARNDGSCNRLL
jgi:DNA-binding transcriptional ArsR family regulator